ncbi:MAG TPA: lamin tail domain-containing protein, partial [Nocardioidaceae bacterium]|nr:lamin tail domain-containing protein [Nocardioidaceae bacterium]
MKSRRGKILSRTIALGAPLVVVAALVNPLQASAASTDVVINELMYNPATGNDGDEFLELYNQGSAPVDLSGWSFSGITLTFAAGTTIAGNGYVVVSKDAARYQVTYGGTPNAVYTGSLSNGGEAITLKDATAAVIDTVTYSDRAPWPGTPDGQGDSLELVDPTADNTDYLDWAGSTAALGYTPRAQNSVRRSGGVGPRITAVSASPTAPAPNQAVTVTATVTGQTSAPVVRYRIDFNAEQTIAMTNAGGDTYTANVPGAAAGHLIRYRVAATNSASTSLVPRTDDTTVYQGVVVPSGISSPIRMLEWFISDADYNTITASPTADIIRKAAIAYNGTVIDNVSVNIRGANSQSSPKPNWKFELPHNYSIDFGLVEPVDEFAMQGDWSDKSHGRPMLAWDAYKRAGVISSTAEQLFPMRTQRNAQFQGFYTYLDLFDGTWRDREGYSGTTQFFKSETGAFDPNRPIAVRFEKKNPEDTDFSPLQSFLSGIALTGNAQRDYLLGNLDIPQVINMLAVTAIVDHEDFSSKNFYFALRPETGRWSMIPWDLDHTWGNGCCGVNSTYVTPAETGDRTNDLARAVLAVPQWREMYFRRLRTLVNDILAPARMEALYDAYMGPAQPVTVQDYAAWPYTGSPTYASMRTQLFNALQARRNVFANDSRVPSSQPASPNIVINEIQHSPTGGTGAEFLELSNPNSTAIDISGWTISDGISLTVQPGTVIPANGTMTFVSNDLTFKSTYGSTVFVGGRFTGDLAASETLTLLRADGSTADAVTYGGAGWPVPTAGQSLELTNPAADNNDP